MNPIEGGCLCGAVRYKSTAAPTLVPACWCRVQPPAPTPAGR